MENVQTTDKKNIHYMGKYMHTINIVSKIIALVTFVCHDVSFAAETLRQVITNIVSKILLLSIIHIHTHKEKKNLVEMKCILIFLLALLKTWRS